MFSQSDNGKVVQYIGAKSSHGDINGEIVHANSLFQIVEVLEDGRIKVRDHIYGFDNGISDLRLCIYDDTTFRILTQN